MLEVCVIEVLPPLCSANFPRRVKLLFLECGRPLCYRSPILAAEAGLSVGFRHARALGKVCEAGLPRVCGHEGPGACWERSRPKGDRVQGQKLGLQEGGNLRVVLCDMGPPTFLPMLSHQVLMLSSRQRKLQ